MYFIFDICVNHEINNLGHLIFCRIFNRKKLKGKTFEILCGKIARRSKDDKNQYQMCEYCARHNGAG